MLDKEQQTNFYEIIGDKIREARKLRNMNQDLLADRLGISRVSLGNIETGKQRVPLHVLLDICESLNVTMNDIVPQNVKSDNLIDQSILNKIKRETEDSPESSEKVLNYVLSLMKKHI
ncbi:MAG: XRE family transcriptional regulator [Sphingobacteriaceae bacterium]|nr:MAG: XRE family transcriptional regulator [Sphingobacteriaceae bacterium]